MAIKLKSEIRIKSVNGIAAGNEGQGDLFEEGDIVYSIADTDFKKRNSSAYNGGSAAASWDTVSAGGSGIANVVDDTSPQLGANLDVQANEITTATANGNIKIAPNGTGALEIKGNGGNDGQIQLNCSNNSHGVKIKSPPHSSGADYTLVLPVDDGSSGEVLRTDGSGVLSWVANAGSSTLLGLSDTPGDFTGHANKFVKVNSGASAIEFVNVNVPGALQDLSNVDAFAGGNADQGKLAVVKNASDAIDFIPLHSFSTHTVAVGAGSDTDLATSLNGSLSGTIVVNNTGNNEGGSVGGKGVKVNIAGLTALTKSNPRFEILSGTSSLGFRFKAETTNITSFGGQSTIANGVGNTDGVSVGSSQKLVLLYNGTAWQYMIQSI